jgi:hypothetical protein
VPLGLRGGIGERFAADRQGISLKQPLTDLSGHGQAKAGGVDGIEKVRSWVDAIGEIFEIERGDFPLPAPGVQERRVFWQFM